MFFWPAKDALLEGASSKEARFRDEDPRVCKMLAGAGQFAVRRAAGLSGRSARILASQKGRSHLRYGKRGLLSAPGRIHFPASVRLTGGALILPDTPHPALWRNRLSLSLSLLEYKSN